MKGAKLNRKKKTEQNFLKNVVSFFLGTRVIDCEYVDDTHINE